MTKKQHYIPQFLLRNWSFDGHSINVFLMNGRTIPNAAISSQAQRHYYYGADQKIEKLYGEIESPVATLLREKIFCENLDFTQEEKNVLLFFVTLQNVRTPNFIESSDDTITEILKAMLQSDKRFKAETHLLDDLKISFNNPQYEQLKLFLTTFLIYADLRISLLKADNDNEFVIGQDPVVTLNPFLCEKKLGWIKTRYWKPWCCNCFAFIADLYTLYV